MVTILGGLIGGLVATIVMSAVMKWMGDSPPPTANFLATFLAGDPADFMMPGVVLHLLYGTIAGGVFVTVVTTVGLGITTPTSWIGVGIAYGVILMIGGAIVWIRGVIGMVPDREMMIQIAVVHVVYGIVLGAWIAYAIPG